jgi:hypothetical protein
MKIQPSAIDISSPRIKRPVPKNAIFWPSVTGYGSTGTNSDSIRFPNFPAIKARAKADAVAPLDVFTDAASGALDRLLIVDAYLFNPREGGTQQSRIDQVMEWFPSRFVANDVRLLAGAVGDSESDIVEQFTERAIKINRADRYRAGVLTVQIKFSLKRDFPYVHDRFAVIDDELWHFGGTVGGFHEHVTAASRGWDADEHDAVAFFDLAWKGDPDLYRSK